MELANKTIKDESALIEASYKIIKLLRPDLHGGNPKILFEEYLEDLKNILSEYID